jgi:hypothetical protein
MHLRCLPVGIHRNTETQEPVANLFYMSQGEHSSTVGNVTGAVATLHQLAATALRAATESLEWRGPRDQIAHERATTSFFSTALHQYSTSMATLTVFVTSEPGKPFDVRVTCEIGDAELVNAERIVHEAGVADDEVREWLTRQFDRCVAALVSRIRGR